MISRARPFLGKALAISIVLHGLLVAAPAWRGEAPAQAPLTVWLRGSLAEPELQAAAPTLPMPALAKLLLPAKAARNADLAKPAAEFVVRQTGPLRQLSSEAARSAGEQMARELLYPPEAIERGLQGEALVLLFLDESGNAIAARLEASSGHALLDDAAVRAARTPDLSRGRKFWAGPIACLASPSAGP